jgi:hypothetical protein
VEGVGAFRCFTLVLRAAAKRVADSDAFDHEHFVLEVDLAFSLGRESPLARVDPARLQRATEGADESTGGRGDYVIEGGGVVGVLAGRRAVMLAHLVVGAEEYGVGFGRQEGPTDGTPVADDPNA